MGGVFMRHKFLGLLVLIALTTVSIIPSFIFTSTAQAEFFKPELSFKATIRDFQPSTHRDFENSAFLVAAEKVKYGPTEGMVAPTLDSDKKPVFVGKNGEDGGMATDATTFSQWYRDSGVNTSIPYEIVLNHVGGGVYNYKNDDFFPINDKGFGNYTSNKNYHFTTEIQSKFVYNGGEEFTFNGDDDLWVFIDNKLVIDIGGIHGSSEKKVRLDDVANDLGLEKGRIYDFRLFHAERQTTQSTFEITTSIAFKDRDDYEMSIKAKVADGEYSNNIVGYIGQPVELEYRIPTQKINFPEGVIRLENLTSNFKSFIPPGIEVTDCSALLEKNVTEKGTQLTEGINFKFDIGIDPDTGEYRVEELVIIVKGILVEKGKHNLITKDTDVSYTLNYTCDSILGQKDGKFKVANNVEIKVEPFEVEITGPDSLMLGQKGEYTAKLSVKGIIDPVFVWSTDDGDSIEIIEPKTLNDISTVTVKGNTKGDATLKVEAYSKNYDKHKAQATKVININWTVDIN